MPFYVPMILRKMSNGKTYCRPTNPGEQPDVYSFGFWFQGQVYIFENGMIAACEWRDGSYDSTVIVNRSDIFASDSSWWDQVMITQFRQNLVKAIAEQSLRLEQERAKVAEMERAKAAERERAASAANEGPQKSGGCYIATAVYGSYDCPQVWTLRRFRDNTLAESLLGRAFVRAYYAVSPALVRWFGETAWFHRLWRGPLDRLVAFLRLRGVEDTPYQDRDW